VRPGIVCALARSGYRGEILSRQLFIWVFSLAPAIPSPAPRDATRCAARRLGGMRVHGDGNVRVGATPAAVTR
jgi:hypothetical protein